ncbi:MAG: hypothetical protein KJO21_05350 [Verrucomicrobiae bacterium]|nr:hypothetical protein [Verrucomicrobiae bacterium]NNJ43147.1 hypothetical protein [Akkermansiaceae bacterium]
MSKKEIVRQIAAHLNQQLATMKEAAKATHEASTGDEAKAEGKYDTRGLEASYLADAQAEQCQKLERSVHVFESLILADHPSGGSIGPGDLVETEHEGIFHYYLLTPCAGGISIEYEGYDLTTVSPEAPLYQDLLDRQVGDKLDHPPLLILDVF